MSIRLAIIALLLACPAIAKDLYVDGDNPNCSDLTLYANNSQTLPWCTLGRAVWGSSNQSSPENGQAAQAGDVVYVSNGPYSAPGTGLRHAPAFNPANSGTPSAPISFVATESVQLTLSSGAGPVIGSVNRDYIVWSGFYIDEASAPSVADTGSVVIWDNAGTQIINCTIDGNGTAGNRLDNHTGVRLEYAINPVIRGNTIYDVTTGLGAEHHNGAGVMSYYSSGAIIENNEISNCGAGVFIKGGDNANFLVRYNWLAVNGNAVEIQYTAATGLHRIEQNIAVGGDAGYKVALYSHNVSIENNVSFNSNNGLVLGSAAETITNITVKNNIFHATSEYVSGGYSSTAAYLTIDHNLYTGTATAWSLNGIAYTSLAAWQTALGGTTYGDESHSAVGDPLFTAPGTDFTLQAGSPALTMSDTYGPVGAYLAEGDCVGLCGSVVLPVCETTPSLCTTQSECHLAGWYWCDTGCQSTPCSTLPPDPGTPTGLFNKRISYGGSVISFEDS